MSTTLLPFPQCRPRVAPPNSLLCSQFVAASHALHMPTNFCLGQLALKIDSDDPHGAGLKHARDGANEEFGERLPLRSMIAKLVCTVSSFLPATVGHSYVTNLGPHLRGEPKTKLKPLAVVMLGFESDHSKDTITFNRDLAEKLKEGTQFASKACVC
ncbi:hypothetical protein DFH09DRAFT_1088890 [Mycena vulgaris]|nr:hypothetical protein DFH09DRAFT_1088890 [Mycena vulgaris]